MYLLTLSPFFHELQFQSEHSQVEIIRRSKTNIITTTKLQTDKKYIKTQLPQLVNFIEPVTNLLTETESPLETLAYRR